MLRLEILLLPGRDRLRQVAAVFPDQVAGRGVERLDLVGVIQNIEDAIMDDRRPLCGAVRQRPPPGDPRSLTLSLLIWSSGL